MNKPISFLKKELLEMIPPTLFFLVVFHVVLLARALIGAEGGIRMTTSAAAIVAALVVGKSVLIADALPLFRWLRDRRLIYNVVWRVFLYLGIVLVFQMLEELIPLVSKHGGVAAAAERVWDEIDRAQFWGTHLVLAFFMIFYALATALIGAIGGDRFLEIFFGSGRAASDAGAG